MNELPIIKSSLLFDEKINQESSQYIFPGWFNRLSPAGRAYLVISRLRQTIEYLAADFPDRERRVKILKALYEDHNLVMAYVLTLTLGITDHEKLAGRIYGYFGAIPGYVPGRKPPKPLLQSLEALDWSSAILMLIDAERRADPAEKRKYFRIIQCRKPGKKARKAHEKPSYCRLVKQQSDEKGQV